MLATFRFSERVDRQTRTASVARQRATEPLPLVDLCEVTRAYANRIALTATFSHADRKRRSRSVRPLLWRARLI